MLWKKEWFGHIVQNNHTDCLGVIYIYNYNWHCWWNASRRKVHPWKKRFGFLPHAWTRLTKKPTPEASDRTSHPQLDPPPPRRRPASPPRPPPRVVQVPHVQFADADAQAAALRARAGRLERVPPTATGCSTRSSPLRETAGRRRRTRGSGRISTLDPAEAYVDTDAEALAAAAALYALPLLAEPCLSGSPAMYAAVDLHFSEILCSECNDQVLIFYLVSL